MFDRTLEALETGVSGPLVTTGAYDLLGLLLCVQLVHAMIDLVSERGTKILEK